MHFRADGGIRYQEQGAGSEQILSVDPSYAIIDNTDGVLSVFDGGTKMTSFSQVLTTFLYDYSRLAYNGPTEGNASSRYRRQFQIVKAQQSNYVSNVYQSLFGDLRNGRSGSRNTLFL